jgi:hypothetical protein
MEAVSLKQSEKFNLSQLQAIDRGKSKRNRMVELISNITQMDQNEKYSNLYIYSPPGLGKTYTVKEFLKDSQMDYYQVSGNTSLFAFGIRLATISFLNQEKLPVIIYVDDCDEIFKNDQNCDTMKKVLDAEKCFCYEKSLSSQWSNLSEIQKSAIKYFSEEGRMGFVVPTHNMRFIFTSNFQLPIDDEVTEARKKNKSKVAMLAHRNAIRSRCKVGDFELTKEEHWGWIADVVLSSKDIGGINTDDEKKLILEFIWNNWSCLTERSIRLIEKMAITMRIYPENYDEVWSIDYLRNM